MRPATAAIHAGLEASAPGQPVPSPLVLVTSFRVRSDDVGFSANDLTWQTPPFYARGGNSTAESWSGG
jgi:O-acetylhomoserine/O-acetylserine sulfhydrylase-like pyridoxal-dependent enzyme